jgi:hypothetical protein
METCRRCGIRAATKAVTYDLYNLPKATWFPVDAKVCDVCSDRLKEKQGTGGIRNYQILQQL